MVIPVKTPQPGHTVSVPVPGTPDVQTWLTSSTGGLVMAAVVIAIICVSAFKHLPKWLIGVGFVLILLVAGIITLNPRAVGG